MGCGRWRDGVGGSLRGAERGVGRSKGGERCAGLLVDQISVCLSFDFWILRVGKSSHWPHTRTGTQQGKAKSKINKAQMQVRNGGLEWGATWGCE